MLSVSSFILTIVGTMLSVLSIVYAVITTRKNNRKEKNSKTINWEQLLIASKYICRELKKSSFIPDVILTPGQKGGIFAQLIMDNLDLEIPIITGFLVHKDDRIANIKRDNYIHLNTTKCNIFIPEVISEYKNNKILIVDDFVMSGDFLHTIKKKLTEEKFDMKNVISISIVTTNVAISSKKSPNYYWKIVDSDDCYFPWGKAR